MEKGNERLQFLSSAIEQCVEGIAIAGLDDRLMYVNPAWAAMHGYDTGEELIGKSLKIFHNQEQIETNVEPFNLIVKEKGKYTGELGHMRKDGTPFPTLMTITLLKDAQGIPVAMLGTAQDITDRKKVENLLFEKEHLLSESQRIAHIGSWSQMFDDKTGRIAWTEEMYTVYGVDPSSFTPDIPSFFNLIHPDDRPLMQAWIEECITGKQPGELVFRNLRGDGSIHFISGQGDLLYDAYGKPIGVAGTAQDITERRETDEALKIERDNLQKALDEIKTLRGIIPICSYCKKIRDDEGAWSQVEEYVNKHTHAEFSHGVCPECYETQMKEFEKEE